MKEITWYKKGEFQPRSKTPILLIEHIENEEPIYAIGHFHIQTRSFAVHGMGSGLQSENITHWCYLPSPPELNADK